MIKHYPFNQLGKANHGWLKANFHFSFAHYYNPKRMGFGKLRVINDDTIAPHTGFPPHPHQNMEIITFVRSGAVSHEDSKGNKGVTAAGQVQVMSAGSGIVHSEYNKTDQPLTLYQIWIEPNKLNVQPRWESKLFPNDYTQSSLPLLVSGFSDDENTLFIHQQARIYGGKLKQQTTIEHPITGQAYLLVSKGEVTLSTDQEKITMQQGDGAEITTLNTLPIYANADSEILIIEVPVT